MPDIFDGDIYVTVDADGADYVFKGGQPVMDPGMENHVNISLMTVPGWCGNDIEPVNSKKIGSQYIGKVLKSITRQSLLDTSKAAESDLSGEEFGKITVATTNPESQQILTEILLEPPSGDALILRLLKSGNNWTAQKINPANKIIN